MQSSGKTKLVDLNELLTCILCKGYFIDATTIVECLHSFCRTCIVRYLQLTKFCPSCEVQVHKTRPLLNIRSDQTLQDIVYKLVPGLFKNEMKRRRDFYQQNDVMVQCAIPASSEKRGDVWGCDRLIFTPEDIISVSLEYTPLDDQLPINLQTNTTLLKKNKRVQYYKRYFNCPGALKVHHLKKLLQAKYGLVGSKKKVDILYMHDLLKDQYTLVDLAYIYSWKRSEPLRLFFKITPSSPKPPIPSETPLQIISTPFSPSTSAIISSSMAATPSSGHPSPPPSPQMAQEPKDIRGPLVIWEHEPEDVQGKEIQHIQAMDIQGNKIQHIQGKQPNDQQPGQGPNPGAIKSGQDAGVMAAILPEKTMQSASDAKVNEDPNKQSVNDLNVPSIVIPKQKTTQSASDAKINEDPDKQSKDDLNVPSMIVVRKPNGQINGILADRTVSEANLRSIGMKLVGNRTAVLTSDEFVQGKPFSKTNSTFDTSPKLKSALKRTSFDIPSTIRIEAKRQLSMDSPLSNGFQDLSPSIICNGYKSSPKKRVSFSVNLVQDCEELGKRKAPDYFDDESTSPFKIDPVKGSAIGGVVHMRKKVLSNSKSS